MTDLEQRPNRHADLWLSDFSADPREIARALPAEPFLIACKGEPAGRQQRPARRNVIIYRESFSVALAWSEVIESLISSLGGWERIGELFHQFPDMRRLIQLTLPISGSPHQENNAIDAATLGRLAALLVDFGMEFGDYREPL